MSTYVDWIIECIRNGECESFNPIERIWIFHYSESTHDECLVVTDEQLKAMEHCSCVKHRIIYKDNDGYFMHPRWSVSDYHKLDEVKKHRRWTLTPYQSYFFNRMGTLEIKIVGRKWYRNDLALHEKEMRQDLENIEIERNKRLFNR
jgi:hypothetical protein